MVIFNDASIHGQFAAAEPFWDSFRTLWKLRKRLIEKGLHLKVCRSIRTRKVTASQNFNDLLRSLPSDLKSQLLVWLDHKGPFWDDERRHSENEYFECDDEIVTDTGAAEAAVLEIEGTKIWLFSIAPSNYLHNPLQVAWRERSGGDLLIDIPNGWTEEQVEECAKLLDQPFKSWDELLSWAQRECKSLVMSPDIAMTLPDEFMLSVPNQAKVLLQTLNTMVEHIKNRDEQKFNPMWIDWVHGDKARFSDSSNSEINEFGKKLTFRDPESGDEILCSWHGKIRTRQFRIHFDWPLPDGADKLFVAYVGPKITKR